MARPKQIDDSELLNLIERFYREECRGDVKKLKYEEIAKYIQNNGYPDYKATSLRRDSTAKTYIENFKNQTKKASVTTVSTYKTLDIEEFINNNRTPDRLRRSLTELDAYYKSVADSAARIFNEYNALVKKYEEMKDALEESRIVQKDTVERSKDSHSEVIALKKEIKVLNSVINTYVYPEIANELLAKERIKMKTTGIIDKEKLDEQIITAETPVNDPKSGSKVIRGLFDSIDE